MKENFGTIFYDDKCGLCLGAIRFISMHDPGRYFRYQPFSSEYSSEKIGAERAEERRSIVLLEKGRIYEKSTAVLRIAQRLEGLYKLFGLLIVVPASIRDFVYDRIAERRK